MDNPKALHTHILDMVVQEEFSKALKEISKSYPQRKWWNLFGKLERQKGEYAFELLAALLQKKGFQAVQYLEWRNDFVGEVAELFKAFEYLEKNKASKEIIEPMGNFLVDFTESAATYIEESIEQRPPHNPYPKTWFDGSVVRSWAEYLATYLKDIDPQKEEKVRLSKARISAMIMGHYPEQFGPDLAKAADLVERNGQTDFAITLYEDVIKVISPSFDRLEVELGQGIIEWTAEGRIIANCLRTTVLALKRLNSYNDPNSYLERSESIIERLKDSSKGQA
ncbi:MAG: hypothetical protein MRZ79_22790 [Bacteroidia bacterium]|nr:hypothetical protein [Bacteroidia bacterium]